MGIPLVEKLIIVNCTVCGLTHILDYVVCLCKEYK